MSRCCTHAYRDTETYTHTLVPVTRESWRIGIFSTHQRGTLKNGTRILFTVSREEWASFSTRRGMEVAEWKSKRCQTSVERKRLGHRTYAMEFANDIFLTSRFSFRRLSFRSNFSSTSSTTIYPFFTLYFSNVNRDVALLGFSRRRGQIDQSPIAMPLPNLQLLVLHRSESDRDLRPGWTGVHQRQAKGAERLVEPKLRRQSRAQRHD